MNKVLCVMFHAKQDIVLSNSDDKSIRVWDVTKRTCVQAFPREHDWFWILASHPEMNLLAAGHDSGMIVFKLERERPALSVNGDLLYNVKHRFLRFYEFSTQKDSQVIPIRRPCTTSLNQSPRTLSYSAAENDVLVCSDVDGSSYELYTIPKDSISRDDTIQDAKRGVGGSAVFVTCNRFAVRQEQQSSQRFVRGDLQTPFIKYVVWSNDMESIASLNKHSIATWDDNGVFVYKILNHIKYCLPNGDSGIIKTLDVPIYITEISGNTLFCLDWDWKNRAVIIDATEYVFKLSLLKKKYDQVISFIRNSQLSEGFPEVALHFVKDERTRFYLAIESVNIQITVALENAIDEKDHWYRLGVEALCQGNAGIVEYAYQRTKNFDRFSFLYLVMGNICMLSKMLKIAGLKNDVMSQFRNVLYDCIWEVQSFTVHGLNDVAEQLEAKLGDNVPSFLQGKVPSLLMPPHPSYVVETGSCVQEEDEEAADADWGKELDIVDGMPVSQIWIQKSSLAGGNAAAGNFDSAMRLLSRKLGIQNFTPLKPMFLVLHAGSHSYLCPFCLSPIIILAVERGWSETSSRNSKARLQQGMPETYISEIGIL
ncbi:hypothetical protein AQUCO_00300209v1 [Aquilegia coerulea]|uniref:Uncharacterized protein n=1 Tax=Aquilegia coerulea TaxID=218851 RepID=A0A2G5EY26_AQUCA|nr:hypothetical protein AQUCO_00300209v1 [Aquilegia coerulea]